MKQSVLIDYYKVLLIDCFDEYKVNANYEQVNAIAGDIAIAHENYGMTLAPVEHPMIDEIASLKKELKKERSKQVCPECKGKGGLYMSGPVHGAISQCHVCNGEGKVTP